VQKILVAGGRLRTNIVNPSTSTNAVQEEYQTTRSFLQIPINLCSSQ
jgi:hypothetical protein